MKQFLSSQRGKHVIKWLGAAIVLLLTFQAGIFIGFHKASMLFHFDKHYERAYGEHFRGGPLGIPEDDFPEAHGAVGRILSVNLPTFIIEDKGNAKVVRITDDTVVRRQHSKVATKTIAVNEFAVIIGSPNSQSEIDAKFIRILPPPLGFVATSTMSTTTYSK